MNEFEKSFSESALKYLNDNGITIDFKVGDKIKLLNDLSLKTGKTIKKEETLTVRQITIKDMELTYLLWLEEYGIGISPLHYNIKKIEEE